MAPQDYRKLYDQHVLVIGGSSGIGFGVAEASLASGAHVTIASSSQARLDAAAKKLADWYPDRRVRAVVCDLSPGADLDAALQKLFVDAVAAHDGATVQHVVHSAGDGLVLGELNQVANEAAIHRALHLRLIVSAVVGKVTAQHVKPFSAGSGSGCSLTLTSGSASQASSKGWLLGTTATGSLEALARALAVELAPAVRVNVVRPGVVATDLWKVSGLVKTAEDEETLYKQASASLPLQKVGTVENVAEAYLWLMKDGNATGSIATTDGGNLIV